MNGGPTPTGIRTFKPLTGAARAEAVRRGMQRLDVRVYLTSDYFGEDPKPKPRTRKAKKAS